jgi:hypothetical protein
MPEDGPTCKSICTACHRKKTLAESHEAAKRKVAERKSLLYF